jgi:hypothetical protein
MYEIEVIGGEKDKEVLEIKALDQRAEAIFDRLGV